MKYKIDLGDGKKIILEHDSIDKNINVDDLTKINTSNIYGEAVTISAAVNRIGLIKSEVEARMTEVRLEEKVYEGKFIANLRREAANNGGFYHINIGGDKVKVKLTEASLKTAYVVDEGWIKIRKRYITAEKNFNALSSLYWSCQDKARKINGLVSGTTPEDFVQCMIEGKINGMLVRK